MTELATRHDLHHLEERITLRMTLRLGVMLVATIGVMAALPRVFTMTKMTELVTR